MSKNFGRKFPQLNIEYTHLLRYIYINKQIYMYKHTLTYINLFEVESLYQLIPAYNFMGKKKKRENVYKYI